MTSKAKIQILSINLIQVRNIKTMIAKAGSLEEIEKLNQMLRTGQMPGMAQNGAGQEEMEQGY